MVADGAVVHFDEVDVSVVDDEFGVAGAEVDAEDVELVEDLVGDVGGVCGGVCAGFFDEVGGWGGGGVEAAEDVEVVVVAECF